MKFLNVCALIIMLTVGLAFSVHAGKADCENIDGDGAKPVKEVGKEGDAKSRTIMMRLSKKMTGRVSLISPLLAVANPNRINADLTQRTQKPNGQAGGLDVDNATIGEGAGTRNHIVIGGIYFERGLGAHAIGTLVYDLSGDKYLKFEGYVGMSDEKDPAECGHGGSSDFIFSIDGKQVFKSETLQGTDGGKNVDAVKVEIDIPSTAKELEIIMGDGGDGIGCDHSAIGDAKLLNAQALAVEPANKLPTIWGHLKDSY